jgi:hypothetical protein
LFAFTTILKKKKKKIDVDISILEKNKMISSV